MRFCEDPVDLHNLKDVSPKLMEDYSILILGIPTWDFGELQEDWEAIWAAVARADLKGKIVAKVMAWAISRSMVSGSFDALGMLHDHIAPLGVQFIGFWPTEGFEFTSPKPLSADGKHFVGLAPDEVNQYDLSEERLQQWCEQILLEMEPLL